MPKLASRTPKQVIAILKRCGFALDYTTGSHHVFYDAKSKRRVTVAFHRKDIPKGTLHAILKQAGLTADDL